MAVSERNRRIFEECAASDEPCIVFRAKDALAPPMLEFYANIADQHGCSPEFVQAVRDHEQAFMAWAFDNQDKLKMPDLRPGEGIQEAP